jgi:hypothetical protein
MHQQGLGQLGQHVWTCQRCGQQIPLNVGSIHHQCGPALDLAPIMAELKAIREELASIKSIVESD